MGGGEVSEWPKEPISKIGRCSDVPRGFESHPLRQNNHEADVAEPVERCWSGRSGTPGKRVGAQVPRGFESHPLRHTPQRPPRNLPPPPNFLPPQAGGDATAPQFSPPACGGRCRRQRGGAPHARPAPAADPPPCPTSLRKESAVTTDEASRETEHTNAALRAVVDAAERDARAALADARQVRADLKDGSAEPSHEARARVRARSRPFAPVSCGCSQRPIGLRRTLAAPDRADPDAGCVHLSPSSLDCKRIHVL